MINFLANSNCATSSFVAIIIAVILGILLILIVRGIKIVPQTQAFIIERLGKYYKTWGTGVHFLWPFIDRVATDPNASYSSGKLTSPRVIGKVNLKEQVIDFDPQPVITKDNVTMQIDAVIYYQITDPKSYVYGVTNPLKALDTLNTTTLYGAYNRNASHKTPSLQCPREEDEFSVSNGKLTYPVALLTIDEVAMAGGVNGQKNSLFYLYTGQSYWTLSPSNFRSWSAAANVWSVISDGLLGTNWVSTWLGVRPVVNLSSDILISGGTGTANNPYVVTLQEN